MRALVAVLAALLAVPAAAAEGEIERGRALYNFRCYFCHGYSGDAKTLAASFLSPPPRNFSALAPGQLEPASVVATLKAGRAGTAMPSFAAVLGDDEMAALAAFVVAEFVVRKAPNTRYHTAANGWPEHERYAAAYPFATGEIALSREWEKLSADEAAGKRLYLASCVSCHDRGAGGKDELAWDARPLSFPRNGFAPGQAGTNIDAMASASPYLRHEIAPASGRLDARERRGERLFQNNCAFCHGADGSGRNWIGQFIEPHPRNLRDPAFVATATPARIAQAIREGLPGTSMPAWRGVLRAGEIDALLAYIGRVFCCAGPSGRKAP